jgi:competence ComEA-like helix-hairpin-helix protein
MAFRPRNDIKIKMPKLLKILLTITVGFFCLSVIAGELININTASLEELDTLPGIGPSKAAAIVDYREANGDFQTIDDIINVSGIGEATFENIKDLITVGEVSDFSEDVASSTEALDDRPQTTDDSNRPSSEEESVVDRITPEDGPTVKKLSEEEIRNIIIHKILPNPEGNDSEGEYIELYNLGDEPVDLYGWALSDNTDNKYIIESEESLIEPQGKYKIMREVSKIVLNNTSDTVFLYPPDSEEASVELEYEGAKSGIVFRCDSAMIEDCGWELSVNSEPQSSDGAGQKTDDSQFKDDDYSTNKSSSSADDFEMVVDFFVLENYPVARPILFDASSSVLFSTSSAKYYWDFGDGFTNVLPRPEHTYFATGTYNIILTIYDGLATGTKEQDIVIVDDSYFSGYVATNTLKITEILPNPEDNDRTDEYIEVYNYGEAPISLSGWGLDDILDSGSKPFIFSDEWKIGPGEYLTVYSEDSGVILNNNLDNAILLDPDGKVVDQVEYEKAEFSKSFARGQNDKWFWTSELSPGEENEIKVSPSTNSRQADDYLPGNNNFLSAAINPQIPVDDISALEKGDQVIINGQVTVEPGIISSQYFYIKSGSEGIQVYSYKKDFPSLKRGQNIQVSGEISEVSAEKRIKIKTKNDIVVISNEEILPDSIACSDLDEYSCGQVVAISGEIVERKGSSLYIDDGEGELRAYIKKSTGISPSVFSEREQITLTGVVSMMSGEKVILPRDTNDIIKKNPINNSPQVLGEIIEGDSWKLEEKNSKLVFYKYLLIVSCVVIVYLGVLLFKDRIFK